MVVANDVQQRLSAVQKLKPGTTVVCVWAWGLSTPSAHPPTRVEGEASECGDLAADQVKMGKGTHSPKHPPNLLHLQAASLDNGKVSVSVSQEKWSSVVAVVGREDEKRGRCGSCGCGCT